MTHRAEGVGVEADAAGLEEDLFCDLARVTAFGVPGNDHASGVDRSQRDSEPISDVHPRAEWKDAEHEVRVQELDRGRGDGAVAPGHDHRIEAVAFRRRRELRRRGSGHTGLAALERESRSG